MDWSQKCAVLIPCLNEEAAIGSLVVEIRKHLPCVLVVDDGSTDATSARALNAGAQVLKNPVPTGKGAALAQGWQHLSKAGFTWAILMDGDGQHAPSDIPKFLECAERTRAELVVGNRLHSPDKIPWLRRQVNRWMSRRLSRLVGYPLSDSQCGYRMVRIKPLLQSGLKCTHFEVESEMIVRLAMRGIKASFIPIQVIYHGEKSKIRPWRDTQRWFQWLRTISPSEKAGKVIPSFSPRRR